jgi:hypothetical protein
MNHRYDVFVSYRRAEPDQCWTRSMLVPELEAKQVSVCIDYRSFELGTSIIESMANAVESSRFTLAILSPRFLESGFTTLERIMAQHLGLEESRRRLIGLILEECVLPLELRPFLLLDATHGSVGDDRLDRLVRTLRPSGGANRD